MRRMQRTGSPGGGPKVAASNFRNYAFVSGVVLHGARARELSTNRWDGSEMYQMYLASRIVAEGRALLSLERVAVLKDIQLPDQTQDSYATKPRIDPCPIIERKHTFHLLAPLVVDAIAPSASGDELNALREYVIAQVLMFTYPFWIVEYRRVQSWNYALGICLGMRPRNLAKVGELDRCVCPHPRALYVGHGCRAAGAHRRLQSRASSAASLREISGRRKAPGTCTGPFVSTELVIVGAKGGTNVGESLFVGASELGLSAELVDVKAAWEGPTLARRLSWHLLGRRPLRLGRFGKELLARASVLRPRWLLTVGIAPVDLNTVRSLRAIGIKVFNYLTDDPWNPAHQAPWALKALSAYDCIFSPRRANLADLERLGCREVRYVPFGYDPRHSFRELPEPALASEVIFVGGADADRVPWMAALLDAGIDLALYGDYWDRFASTRGRSRGHATPEVIRRATASAKLAVCLVRRANRDGHVMRSLEVPATGTCMLAEDTRSTALCSDRKTSAFCTSARPRRWWRRRGRYCEMSPGVRAWPRRHTSESPGASIPMRGDWG